MHVSLIQLGMSYLPTDSNADKFMAASEWNEWLNSIYGILVPRQQFSVVVCEHFNSNLELHMGTPCD